MQQIENPFTDADRLLEESSEPLPPVRLVDFHCELTSEKNALGLYLDGRVSVVVGTHTHVVTGDERILPNGTAYQTDLGHDRARSGASSGSSRGPSCRASSTPCRPASRWGRGPSSSTPPGRHRPGDRSGPRHRAHPAARRGREVTDAPRRRRHDPLPRRATAGRAAGPSTIDLHTHTTRSDGVLRAGRARRGQAFEVGRPPLRARPTTTRSRAIASRRRRGRDPGRTSSSSRASRSTPSSTPRPRAVGRRAPHPRLRDGPRRRGLRGGARGASAPRRRERFCAMVERLRELDMSIDDAAAPPSRLERRRRSVARPSPGR